MRKKFIYSILLFVFCLPIQAKDEYIAQHWGTENGLSQSTVSAIYQDRQGYIWLGTWGGLNRFDGYEFREFRPDRRNANTRVDAIYEDADETLWWTTHNNQALYSLDRNREIITIHDLSDMPAPMSAQIAHMRDTLRIDKRGVVWAVDNKPGILRMRNGKWKRLYGTTDPRWEGLVNKNMLLLYDAQGRLWVNPTGGGFGYYDYDKDEIICPLRLTNTIHTAYVDREGKMWLSTYDRGIDCLDWSEQPYRVHDLSEWGKTLGEVRAMYVGKDGKVEIVPRDKRQIYSIVDTPHGRKYGTRSAGIYDMLCVGDTLVVGTRNHGVQVYYPDGRRLRIADSSTVRCLEHIRDTLYAGTIDGLLRISYDRGVERIGTMDVRCLCTTGDTLWVGTFSNGLLRLTPDTIQAIETGEKSVIAMVTLDHKLYMASETGITQYDIASGAHTYFNPLEKERKAYFTEAKAVIQPDSVILFGFTQGYVEFDPRKVKSLGTPAPLRLQTCYLQNGPVNLSGQKSIHLDYDQGSFSIEYAALEYTDPEHIHYAYKLEGYEKTWHEVGHNHMATYTNLKPGHYTFCVRSTNRAGEWIDNEQKLCIIVGENIWTAWWMVLVYIAIFTAILLVAMNLSRKTERLKQDVRKGEEMTTAKLQFFTNISHELRTPLTLINGPIEHILRYEQLSATARQQLEIVRNNGQRMMRMVNQILDFRKIENRKMRLQVSSCSLMEVVRAAAANFAKEASDRHIQLEVHNRADDDTVWVDRQQIDTVVYNLLSNAFKYSPDNTKIGVTVDERPDYVLLCVSDEGVGISKDRQRNLFQRFNSHSEQNLPTNRPGTGIGLNLVKDIVDLHHGFIEVNSSPGKGTTFVVMFRRGKDHFAGEVDFVGHDARIQPSVPEPNLLGEETAKRRKDLVVIVEDNPDMRTFLASILGSHFDTVEASDGIEALPIIRQRQPALVVTDLMVPNMDGLQLTERIKTGDETSHIPVILLTAKSAIESRLEAMQINADDYLMKPFEPDYLLARVQNIIRQRKELERTYRERLLKMEPTQTDVQSASPEDEFLFRLHAIVEKHLDDSTLTIDMIADEMGIGRTIFYNRLKGLTGLNPVEYLRNMRIKRAATLLRDPKLNISAVTYMVGMSDSRYFGKCFKQVYGITPSEYKRQLGQ